MSYAFSIRASSLPELFDCPARWAAKHLEGHRLPSTGAARLGTAIHAGTAVYDEALHVTGTTPSVEDATDAAWEALHADDEEIVWTADLPIRDAESKALRLTAGYCRDVSPMLTFRDVELPVEPMDVAVGEVVIRLTGTVDRVYVASDGAFGIADLKTGRGAVGADGNVSVDKHVYQLGQYELTGLLAQRAIDQPIEAASLVIGMSTGSEPRTGTGYVHAPSRILVGEEGRPGLLEIAARMYQSGHFPGNPKSMLCTERYCPVYATCWWRGRG